MLCYVMLRKENGAYFFRTLDIDNFYSCQFRAFEALALPSKLSHLERKIALVESCLRNQITASFPVCIKILSCFKRNSVSLWRIKRKQRLQTFA